MPGQTRDCTTLGFASGTATCLGDCGGYDTSGCSSCGNGAVDSGEDCDGSDLDGNDCASVPGSFGSGTLRCTSGCAFDTSSCSLCQNGALDAGEDCDGSNLGGASCTTIGMGFTGGTLGCATSCAYDTSMCTAWTPNGVYTVSLAAAYTCASGLVNYNETSFTFTDDGTTLTVTGGRCTMTGPSVPRTGTRSFSVSCTITGGCDETYTLAGTFTTDDSWTGTYTSEWAPLYAGACADCVDQSHSMTGTR